VTLSTSGAKILLAWRQDRLLKNARTGQQVSHGRRSAWSLSLIMGREQRRVGSGSRSFNVTEGQSQQQAALQLEKTFHREAALEQDIARLLLNETAGNGLGRV
jgi:hypothetical protein